MKEEYEVRSLGSVLCVPFTALTLTVGKQEGHPSHKIPCFANPPRFSIRTGGAGGPQEEMAEQGSRKKTAAKRIR